MELVVRTKECDILKALNNWDSVSQLWAFLHNQRRSAHISIFLGTMNEGHVDHSLHIKMQNSIETVPVHTTFYPATDSWQPENTTTGIVHANMISMYSYRTETFSVHTRRVLLNILVEAESAKSDKRGKFWGDVVVRWEIERKIWKRNGNLKK